MLHEAKCHPATVVGRKGLHPTIPKAHTLADIYKCLHQGVFGIGHSIEDAATFANRLTSDLLAAEANCSEPVLESVSPADSAFRINLRPYRQIFSGRDGSASEILANVCLKSATVRMGSLKSFMESLQVFRKLNNGGHFVVEHRSYMFPTPWVDDFLSQVEDFIKTTGTIPVLGHSPIYKQVNAPSYRVVDRETLERSDLAFLFREGQ